jgi:hypothetical protein
MVEVLLTEASAPLPPHARSCARGREIIDALEEVADLVEWMTSEGVAENRGRGRSAGGWVFLGMIAGVGKTYRMLQEGARKRTGRDAVIGYLEPHGG